jgi:retron-type reverse transcriptase
MEYTYSHALSGTEKQKSNKMIEQVINRRNMHLAYKQILANKGSAGVDGMQVSELKQHIQREREAIVLRIIKGTYLPQPILGVNIPKRRSSSLTSGEAVCSIVRSCFCPPKKTR